MKTSGKNKKKHGPKAANQYENMQSLCELQLVRTVDGQFQLGNSQFIISRVSHSSQVQRTIPTGEGLCPSIVGNGDIC